MMGPAWRVEYPLDISLKKEISDFFLVPFFDRAVKFTFSDTKLPLLSDLISSGDPLLATNRLKLFKNESVSSLAATTAALNSNLGIVRCLSGDSWDFPMTNEQWIRPCAFVMQT